MLSDYEESQGLTADMVRSWLTANGWTQDETRNGVTWWICPTNHATGAWIPDRLDEFSPACVAVRHSMTLQALLRAMNPRLRPGLPSEAAWAAHGGEDGWWIGVWSPKNPPTSSFEYLPGRPIVTKITRCGEHWNWGLPGLGWCQWPGKRGGDDWAFWPVDAHGSKVPWPTDASGTLL